ncbi:MAG: peptidoglycan DD-metalloendopeptidase family protein [Deltaproteobacteria bacterium]|nr:peptidoglycan DD-metalloendopeptidase family protein [Deltaproteobacteria bacterium]
MEKIQTDLSREREHYLRFHEKERELLDQLSGLEREIGEKRKRLTELQEKLAQSRKDLGGLQAEQKRTGQALSEVEGRLAGRLVAFYKFAKRGTIQILASSRDLDALSKRIQYLRVITARDRKLLQETTLLQQRHRREILLVKEKLAAIERMEKEEGERLLGLKEDLDRKVLLLMKIHREREFYETAVKELEHAARRLRETLLHLERAEVKQENLPSHFVASKGRLPMPCTGRAYRSDSAGPEDGHRGIYIDSPTGGEVKAVFAGRVDYSGRLRGYGEVVVINHGSRFFTVSAYLSGRNKEEGETVQAGDVIGFLSRDELLQIARLYFELRQGGVNLDPLEWLKAN